MNRPVLAIVPACARTPTELESALRCLVSIAATAPGLDVLVVDDGSPDPALAAELRAACAKLDLGLARRDEHGGLAAAVNVGLALARDGGGDAVLVDPQVQLLDPGWLERMLARAGPGGDPAPVVGARLVYPTGLLQHAGLALSLLKRDWFHRFRYGPSDLPEALVATRCPVSAGLQLVRHEALAAVGLYDEGYPGRFADVDYCLRTFAAGGDCVYEPSVRAFHHEPMHLARPEGEAAAREEASRGRLAEVWGAADLGRWVQEVL